MRPAPPDTGAYGFCWFVATAQLLCSFQLANAATPSLNLSPSAPSKQHPHLALALPPYLAVPSSLLLFVCFHLNLLAGQASN